MQVQISTHEYNKTNTEKNVFIKQLQSFPSKTALMVTYSFICSRKRSYSSIWSLWWTCTCLMSVFSFFICLALSFSLLARVCAWFRLVWKLCINKLELYAHKPHEDGWTRCWSDSLPFNCLFFVDLSNQSFSNSYQKLIVLPEPPANPPPPALPCHYILLPSCLSSCLYSLR